MRAHRLSSEVAEWELYIEHIGRRMGLGSLIVFGFTILHSAIWLAVFWWTGGVMGVFEAYLSNVPQKCRFRRQRAITRRTFSRCAMICVWLRRRQSGRFPHPLNTHTHPHSSRHLTFPIKTIYISKGLLSKWNLIVSKSAKFVNRMIYERVRVH